MAAGLAHILEKAGIDRTAATGDELDIIIEIGAIQRGTPMGNATRAATGTYLDGLGDDLFQRRVGKKKVGQLARRRRVGASKLDRRRRAHALVVACVSGECRRWAEIDSDGRVETGEGMRAIDAARVAPHIIAMIHDRDPRVVVAPREC